MPTTKPIVTGLRYGDTVLIVAGEVRTIATYVGYAGGPTAMVILDGTEARVLVPRGWIERACTRCLGIGCFACAETGQNVMPKPADSAS